MGKQKQEVSIISLTPEAARRLLANNTFNRPLKQARIKALAKVITDGRWKFNGASIVCARNGSLLDGQHRCHAVIRANKAVRTVFVKGVSSKAFDTIDQGVKRTGADIFHLCGVTNPSVVSSSLAVVHQNRCGYPEGSRSQQMNPDMDERIALFDVLADYEEVVRSVVHHRRQLKGVFGLSMLAGLIFLFQEQHRTAAQRFLLVFANVTAGSRDNPAHVARIKFEELSQLEYKISRQAMCAYLKISWNAFAAGERMTKISLAETLDIPIAGVTNNRWLEND